MAGKEAERDESQDVPTQQSSTQASVDLGSPLEDTGNHEPCMVPLLGACSQDSHDVTQPLLSSKLEEVIQPLLGFKPDVTPRSLRATDDVFPRELYTLPLLQESMPRDVLYGVTQTSDTTTNRDQCTLPLPQQDLPSRDSFILPLLTERGLTTPIGTPVPGRAIALHNGTHTPLSGTSTPIIDCKKSLSMDSVSLILPGPGCNFDTKSQLSMLSDASGMYPICRICQVTGEGSDILISPCRCAGTLQFIHNTCLMRWLEITTKKSRKPPKCELCHYQYHRHKKFKFHHWRTPRVSRQDKVLHIIFLINLLVMIGCAIATVMCFLSDKEQINNFPRNKVELSAEEIITLSCGVLFFVSFFIAMSVQIKARHTVYQLFVKFIMQNMEWEIDEYDKSKDSLYMTKGSPTSYV